MKKTLETEQCLMLAFCYGEWKMFLKSHTIQSENWTAKTLTYKHYINGERKETERHFQS